MSTPLPANSLPPRQGRSESSKLIICACLAVALLGAATFWLTRTPDERQALRQGAVEKFHDLIAETPLAAVGEVLLKKSAEPPLPETVINPPTAKGTLAGREVTGTIAAPLDFGPILPRATQPVPTEEKTLRDVIHEAAEDIAQLVGVREEEPVIFNQEYVAPVTEDTTIRAGYINNLARWLVNRYKPGGNGGTLAVTAQTLNQQCGVALAGEVSGGRAAILRYVFQADMILGLYRLYIDRFLNDLNAQAEARGLDGSARRGLHTAIAGKSAMYARALTGVMNVQTLSAELAQIDRAAENVVDSNLALTTAVFALDELRQNKGAAQQISKGQLDVKAAADKARQAADQYDRSRENLASQIRKSAGPGLDDDTLLFMAAWVGRRDKNSNNSRPALESLVTVLRDLAARCHTIAETP